MRVQVDPERCQGHNRCYALAPELFDVDEYGLASARNDGEVPAGLEDKARLAEANCPEFAVHIEEQGRIEEDTAS
jgi:ferredoxin